MVRILMLKVITENLGDIPASQYWQEVKWLLNEVDGIMIGNQTASCTNAFGLTSDT